MLANIESIRAQVTAYQDECRVLMEPVIAGWIAQHALLPNGGYNVKKLTAAAAFIGTRFRYELDRIAQNCMSHDVYPDFPTIKLYGCDGTGDQVWDVWQMIWRKGHARPEATTIHDHGPSHAGIYVGKGEVTEKVYRVEKAAWIAGKSALRFTAERRRLIAGQMVYVKVPYIHRMMYHAEEGYGVHVYGNPPLDEQTSYTVSGNMLYRGEPWREMEESACA